MKLIIEFDIHPNPEEYYQACIIKYSQEETNSHEYNPVIKPKKIIQHKKIMKKRVNFIYSD